MHALRLCRSFFSSNVKRAQASECRISRLLPRRPPPFTRLLFCRPRYRLLNKSSKPFFGSYFVCLISNRSLQASFQLGIMAAAATQTYFDTVPKNYKDVPLTDSGVDTLSFLQATDGLIAMLDLLGSAAFKPVQSDMAGNVKKIRDKYNGDPAKYSTLQKIVLDERSDKKKTATEALLWLKRGLEFCAKALRRSCDTPSEELTESFTKSYEETLKPFHGMLVRPIFTMAMKACPYRKDFYNKLGSDQDRVVQQLNEWLKALENILGQLIQFYVDGKYDHL